MKKIIFIIFLLTVSCSNNKVVNNLRFNINERIRDVIKFDQKLILFLETTSSVGVIDLKDSLENIENIF